MKQYTGCRKGWAWIDRIQDGANTNTHFEEMHRKLKHTIPEGKKNKRVDKLISALFDPTYQEDTQDGNNQVRPPRSSSSQMRMGPGVLSRRAPHSYHM
ncbi:hypothetical protein HPB48_026849 [Haemaphysalis longicornis]|uniref:Uncharacterized protein n=1 Tax=Haemaphysalis longicornis TaxID=44386 RepID=A0A9J6HAS2_HAELO|nr:hypothetical protein HPB48_026849 [Haemaphysalis longicornis]